jgi:biotin transport system substrate-specific component
MSTLNLSATRGVLSDQIAARSTTANLALVLSGVAITALAAQISVPMWPVPFTGQTFAVLLVGTTLGAARGMISMTLYVLLGSLGLPIFTAGKSGLAYITGPTGGYLIGFVLAAVATGWLAQRQWDRKVVGAFISFLVGTAIIYAVGLPWLSVSLGQLGLPHDASATLQAGLYPFIPGDILKALVAGALLPLAWRFTKKDKGLPRV